MTEADLVGSSNLKVRRVSRVGFAILLSIVVSSLSFAGQPKGAIGFTVEVEGDGSFWKPVIKTAKVVSVRPGSPAEAAGLEVGDEILSVQGVEITDANARKVAKLVEVAPGEHLLLIVKDDSGETREVDIIAGEASQSTEADDSAVGR